MKFRVVLGSIVWTLLVTITHIQVNVGWENFKDELRVLVGLERPELIVGFLPVT